jgi:uncharacterized protein YdcH (DUF465 family)
MGLLEAENGAQLIDSDEEFRRLDQEHREYEQQLEQIANRRPFTQQDWFEESVVKKRKLLVKDHMALLARDPECVKVGH